MECDIEFEIHKKWKVLDWVVVDNFEFTASLLFGLNFLRRFNLCGNANITISFYYLVIARL